MSATALSNIIELCSDVTDKEDPAWETVSEAIQRLRAEQATGVPSRPSVLATVAEKAAAIGKPTIAAVSLLAYVTSRPVKDGCCYGQPYWITFGPYTY